jgi:hypothetical protein
MAKIKLVYWKDKIGGETEKLVTNAFRYGYTIGSKGEWQMLIAKEDKEVKENEITNIRIKKLEVAEGAVVMPCFIMRHALGVVSALTSAGEPKEVEEKRVFDEAIFHSLNEGVVNEGELLGVVNILYAAIERKLVRETVEKWLMQRYKY